MRAPGRCWASRPLPSRRGQSPGFSLSIGSAKVSSCSSANRAQSRSYRCAQPGTSRWRHVHRADDSSIQRACRIRAVVAPEPLRREYIDRRRLHCNCRQIPDLEEAWQNIDAVETIASAFIAELIESRAGPGRAGFGNDSLRERGRHGEIEHKQRLLGDVVVEFAIDVKTFSLHCLGVTYRTSELPSVRQFICSSRSPSPRGSGVARVAGHSQHRRSSNHAQACRLRARQLGCEARRLDVSHR